MPHRKPFTWAMTPFLLWRQGSDGEVMPHATSQRVSRESGMLMVSSVRAACSSESAGSLFMYLDTSSTAGSTMSINPGTISNAVSSTGPESLPTHRQSDISHCRRHLSSDIKLRNRTCGSSSDSKSNKSLGLLVIESFAFSGATVSSSSEEMRQLMVAVLLRPLLGNETVELALLGCFIAGDGDVVADRASILMGDDICSVTILLWPGERTVQVAVRTSWSLSTLLVSCDDAGRLIMSDIRAELEADETASLLLVSIWWSNATDKTCGERTALSLAWRGRGTWLHNNKKSYFILGCRLKWTASMFMHTGAYQNALCVVVGLWIAFYVDLKVFWGQESIREYLPWTQAWRCISIINDYTIRSEW